MSSAAEIVCYCEIVLEMKNQSRCLQRNNHHYNVILTNSLSRTVEVSVKCPDDRSNDAMRYSVSASMPRVVVQNHGLTSTEQQVMDNVVKTMLSNTDSAARERLI